MSVLKTLLFFSVGSLLLFIATNRGIDLTVHYLGVSSMIAWFINGGIVFVLLFVTAILMVYHDNKTLTIRLLFKQLHLNRLTLSDAVWVLGGVSAISILSMLVLNGLTYLSGLYPHIISPNFSPPFLKFHVLQPSEYWIFLIWIPFFFFNIVGEELLWRGYILPRQQVIKKRFNWVLNSAGWLLFHLAFGWQLIVLLLPILLINPYVVQKTGNTWTGILIHGIINGSGFILISLGIIAA